MIVKELADKKNLNRWETYGHEAEKQMAFYLKRDFSKNNEIFVINDIRLEDGDDAAQIDHLIVHRFGFLIIESKSVSTKVTVNEHNEWSRHYHGKESGIPSPIIQGRRQGDFLKNILTEKKLQLLKKKKLFKLSLASFKYDVLVAISDKGIIERKNKVSDCVLKADQIPDKIVDLINTYDEENKKILSTKMNPQFLPETIVRIVKHLVDSDKPKKQADVVKEPKEKYVARKPVVANSKNTKKEKACGKCGSENVQIIYSKNYHFKCVDCHANTSIKLTCKENSCKSRVRKSKLNFFQDCKSCDTSTLYFTNQQEKLDSLEASKQTVLEV